MAGSSPPLNRQLFLFFMELRVKNEPQIFHYITSVTFNRVPVFRSEKACEIFAKQLGEVREKFPYKLIGYVVMPDHFHLLVNLKDDDASKFLLRLRGLSARKIIAWLKKENYVSSLEKLKLKIPQKRHHTFAVWQKNPLVIELYSHKFLRQKLNYIHLNPVRAGFCDHPAKWKWSSYHAYLPHKQGEVPIEMDWQSFWKEEELQELSENKEVNDETVQN
jgi:putative transposase